MPKELNPQQARLKAGMTQQHLAECAGLSVATIQRAERAKRFPRWKHVAAAYRKALGLTP